MCRDLMKGDPGKVVVHYDRHDALATTHQSQGSDMGMMGGLLGYDADDERLINPENYLLDAGIEIKFEVIDSGRALPNLYMVHLKNQMEEIRVEAISTGGGMIELIEINGCPVSMEGDCYETLVYTGDKEFMQSLIQQAPWADRAIPHQVANPFVEFKSIQPPHTLWVDQNGAHASVENICIISPVLPILSRQDITIPFSSCSLMMEFNPEEKLTAWELALAYESARGGITQTEVRQRMEDLYRVMRDSVETGLRGTSYKDRILGPQSVAYQKEAADHKLSKDDALHKVTLYVSAIMEVKSSMGTIVAAPTAGASGTFPGAVLGVADSIGSDKDEIVNALLAGSLVGIFIATHSTFSAEIGGCQAECGSGAGMAAAAIVFLLGGTLEQSMSAASMALQNSMGMICDPIAARVEAPCLGKNVSSAANALTSANMAMAGYDHLIPLDEVIDTMDRVGKSLPRELRCTALGGLAITPAARKIEKGLGASPVI